MILHNFFKKTAFKYQKKNSKLKKQMLNFKNRMFKNFEKN